MRYLQLIGLLTTACFVGLCQQDKTVEPELGWTTEATVVAVYDGDTCTIEVRKFLKLRLEGCWAPELAEPGGPESGKRLADLIEGKQIKVRIGGHTDLWRKRTFGRDVGRAWIHGKDVATEMIRSGHAYATKEELIRSQK